MAEKWYPSTFKGIRYKIHPERKHGVKSDRYIVGQFKIQGKYFKSNSGWLSEGWTESEAYEKLTQYKKNAKTGEGPTTLKEEYILVQAERERIEKERVEEENLDNPQNATMETFYERRYKNWAMNEKKKTTAERETVYFNE